MSVSGANGQDGYYGRPLLKRPVWKWYIAAYFFTGGLAGASSTLALGARLSGQRRLARSAMLTSLAGIAASGPLLVVDLGKPGRFSNMLRVAKPTSPMSVGSWVLTAFAPASAVAAASDVTGLLPAAGALGSLVAGLLGPAVATYTAVLVSDTAIPAWHDAGGELPFLFAGSAAASAGALAMALTPVAEAGPARRMAALGGAVEVAAMRTMKSSLGEAAGRPYRSGAAGRLARAAEACTAAGAALGLLVGRRRRSAAVVAEGSSATIGPQRERVDVSGRTV